MRVCAVMRRQQAMRGPITNRALQRKHAIGCDIRFVRRDTSQDDMGGLA